MNNQRVVLLAGLWETTPIVYNFLKATYPATQVIVEEPVSRQQFLKRRIKKLGLGKVTGQVLFQLLIGKALQAFSKGRIHEIEQQFQLSNTPVPDAVQVAVSSVNDLQCIEVLKKWAPDVVVVHGTRIISKKVLAAINCPFINIHAGITPRYRGSHGAYWALANGDKAHCGVTVHLVDAGIDTGNILAQATIPYTTKDNFATYPYLQLAVGLQLLKKCLAQLEKGEWPAVINTLNSALWHHPTLWGYLWKRFSKGVK